MADLSKGSQGSSNSKGASKGHVETKVAKRKPKADEPVRPLPQRKGIAYTPQDIQGELVSNASAESVSFVTKYRSLRLKVMLRGTDEYGDDAYLDQTVIFSDGAFATTNQELIEVLREHPNFGGSIGEKFKDRPRVSRGPIFWEGGFPADVAEQIRKDKEAITRDKTMYDLGLER